MDRAKLTPEALKRIEEDEFLAENEAKYQEMGLTMKAAIAAAAQLWKKKQQQEREYKAMRAR